MTDDAGKGWSTCRLDEVIDFNPKETLPKGTDAPYIEMAALPLNGRWHDEPVRRAVNSGSRFRDGDTLLARITPCLENGKTAQARGLGRGVVGWGSTEFIVMRAKPGLADPDFVYLLARDPGFREYAIQQMTGTSGRQRVPTESIASFEVSLPTLTEQHRIAEVLGALDERVEACARVTASCDDLVHARWALEFEEDQERPSSVLRDLCTSQYGVTASGETEPVGPRLLRVTDINKVNWVDWRAVPYCRVSPDELAKYSLNVGDVVVARMADPGQSAIIEVPESAVFASYLIRVVPKVPNANYFLFGFLKSRFFTDYAEGASSGSVQQNMNAQTILSAPCAIPSPEALGGFQAWAHQVRQGVVAAIKERAALLDLRDFLLPRLLSGELRVAAAEELVEAAT